MLFALITLLLLVGMFFLRLESNSVLLITGIWAAGWLLVRVIAGGYNSFLNKSSLKVTRLQIRAEEQIRNIIRSDGSVRKKWSDFCRVITSVYGSDSALVCVSEGSGFRVMSGIGIDPSEIKDLSLGVTSELAHELRNNKHVVDVTSVSCDDALPEVLVAQFGINQAYPILKSDSVEGILFVGSGSIAESEEFKDSILNLCSFAGRHLIQPGTVATGVGQTTSAGMSDLNPVSLDSKAHKQYFEITAKLFRIYNTDHLFDTFVSSICRLFQSECCFLFLPAEKSKVLRMRYKSGKGVDELADQTIDEKSSLFDLLLRRPGGYLVDDLLGLTGDNFDLRHLFQHGTEMVVPVNLPEKRAGLLGLVKRVGDTQPYSLDDCEMAHTLCQTVEMILESIHQFRRIEELSYTDSMTGLYNHRYFYKRLTEEILRARRFTRYLGLAIFDIDDFKVFNDSYGHQTGDYILRQLGALFLDSVRSIDIVCRYGGEEFCVIMPESDEDSCQQFMERLRGEVSSHEFRSRFIDKKHDIAVSAGGAIFPSDSERADRLIYCADMALLEAKKSGKNVCRMFSRLSPKGSAGSE
ncbi:MAG: GGDEF domain-containing protein [candidate division Zixibacteria bacterium]|nr:GGDEF domain-containing protein [candidate division Zixibacteria bacterium]